MGLARPYNLKGRGLMPASSAFCSNCSPHALLLKFPVSQVEVSGKQILRQFIKDPLGIDAFVWQRGCRGSILGTEMQV